MAEWFHGSTTEVTNGTISFDRALHFIASKQFPWNESAGGRRGSVALAESDALATVKGNKKGRKPGAKPGAKQGATRGGSGGGGGEKDEEVFRPAIVWLAVSDICFALFYISFMSLVGGSQGWCRVQNALWQFWALNQAKAVNL